MINYGKYKYVRNASWQILLDYNVRQLPVKITDIAKQADIKVVKNSDCHLLKDNQIGLSILIDSNGISFSTIICHQKEHDLLLHTNSVIYS